MDRNKKYRGIILSGFPLSGKSSLSKRLVLEYKWKFFSVGDFWREKHRILYPEGEISFERFWRSCSRQDNLEMDRMTREVLSSGNWIGEARYAINFKDMGFVLAFVSADIDTRARRGLDSGRYKGSLEEIKEMLSEREKIEVRVGRDLYGEDYDYRDPRNYDLIIDNTKLTIEQELEIVRNILNNNNH